MSKTKNAMNFDDCPKCEGKGEIRIYKFVNGTKVYFYKTCPACKGSKKRRS